VLATWAAGVGLSGAVVAWWQIVGRGFRALSAMVVLLLAVPAAAAGAGAAAWVGCGLMALGLLVRRPEPHAVLSAAAGGALLVAAAIEGGVLPALTGSIFLGGVTGEMLLGHWYLVDPTLPRPALRRIALAGGAGVAADVIALVALGAIPWLGGDAVAGIGYLVLAATSALLMVGVWSALGERGYSGVMSATGLSYLAVLTGAGTAVLGRLLLDPPVLG